MDDRGYLTAESVAHAWRPAKSVMDEASLRTVGVVITPPWQNALRIYLGACASS
jgi:hypothetical protein